MVARVGYPNWDLPNLDTHGLQDHDDHTTLHVSTETPPILRSQENILELIPEKRQVSGNSNTDEETQSKPSSGSRGNLIPLPTITRPEEPKPKSKKPGIRAALRSKSSITATLARVSDSDLGVSAGGQGDGNQKPQKMEKFSETVYSESAPDHEIGGERGFKKTGFSKAGFREFGRRVVSRLFVVGDSNDSLRVKMDRRMKGSASESQLPRYHFGRSSTRLSHGELDDPHALSANPSPVLPKIESCPLASPRISRSVPTCEVILPSSDLPHDHEHEDPISVGTSPMSLFDPPVSDEKTRSTPSTPEMPRTPTLRLPTFPGLAPRGRSLSVSTIFFPCHDVLTPPTGGSAAGSPRIDPSSSEDSNNDQGRKLSLPVSHTESDLMLTRKGRKRGYSGPEPMSQSIAAALYSLGSDIKNASSNLAGGPDHARRPSIGGAASPVAFRLASQGGQMVTIEHLKAARQEENDFDPETDCGLGRLINSAEVNEMQLKNMLCEWRAEFAASRQKREDHDDE